jgi:parallel beta-helix repeat protein
MKRNSILPILAVLLTGFLVCTLNTYTVRASGTVYIRADGSVDPPMAPIATFDNVTYVLTGNISESVVIERDGIIVDGAGYTIQGTGSDQGILLAGRNNVTIQHVTITTFSTGILLTGSSNNNRLVGNNVTANSGIGIWLRESPNNTLSDNKVTYNGDGIYLFTSANDTLTGNIMENNTYNFGVYGTDSSTFTHSVDTSNLVDGKPVYYFVNQSNTVISPEAYQSVGYLGFVNCANITVQGLNPPNNVQGILLAFTTDSKITGNNLTNHSAGIYLWSSSNNILSDNSVANNGYGIALVSSSNNKIFHNSLTNNPTQAHTENCSNTWDDDYPSGGNWWSDYGGNDSDQDGIGDSPYTVDLNNTDRYPLMGTYYSYNTTLGQTVQAISNSTISSFTFNGTAISFNVSGQTGSTGFCRICIPTTLMNPTYKVFVNNTEVTYAIQPFSNSTNKYFYFNYTHPTEEVVIIPEFAQFFILALFITATLIELVISTRKRSLYRTRGGTRALYQEVF